MKNMKDNKKRTKRQYIAGAIAILLAVLMILGSLSPFLLASEIEETSQIEMEVIFGYSGFYKIGYPTPVKAKLKNSGKHFKGEFIIRVSVSGEGYGNPPRNVEHAFEVDLPENGSKEFETDITLDTLLNANNLKGYLKDEKGNVVVEKTFKSSAVNPEKDFAMVLTDTPANLTYLKNISLDYYNDIKLDSGLVFATNEEFPNNYEQLSAFSYIFISNFDTSRLSSLQMEAIKTWLNNGGMLVIGTGDNYNKVLKGFSDYIDYNVISEDSIVDMKGLFSGLYADKALYALNYNSDIYEYEYDYEGSETSLYDYLTVNATRYGEENDTIEDGLNYVDLEINSEAGKNENHFDLYHSIEKGKGKIIITEYDFGMPPGNKNTLLTDGFSFVLKLEKRKNVDNYERYYYTEKDFITSPYTLATIPREEGSKIWIIYGLVIVYSIFIGPILYFILKKKDKRERGFIIIPAIALLLTGAISAISYSTIYKKPIVNIVNRVDIIDGKVSNIKATNVGVSKASKGDILVDIAGNDLSFSLLNNSNNYYDSSYYYETDEGSIYAKILKGANPSITYYDNESWATNLFKVNETIDIGGTVDVDIKISNSKVVGEIVNNTDIDFEDVVISFSEEGNHYIGDIKAGETIVLGKGGVAIDRWKSGYYVQDLYKVIYNERSASNSDMWISELRTSMLTYTNSEYFYNSSYGLSPYGTNNNKAKICLFTSEDIGDFSVTLNGANPLKYNNTIFVMDVAYDYLLEGKYSLDFGEVPISEIVSKSGVDYDYGYSSIYAFGDEIEVIFNFTDYKTLKSFQINSFIAESYSSNLKAEIYNYATESYEPIKLKKYSDNVSDYFSEEGNLKIKITQITDSLSTPKIRLEGEK